MQEAIVIGGGITGVATAYELGKLGVKVTLLERERIGAMGTGWTMAGVRQSGRLAPELPIAREAIRRWETLGDELGADIDYRQNGNFRLAVDDEQAATIKQVVADGQAAGIDLRWMDADETHQLAPELTDAVVGASNCPTDGHADNHKTVEAYARAVERQGATVRAGVEVLKLATDGNRVTGVTTTAGDIAADVVVVAAGIYTTPLLEPLGLQLPTQIILCPVAETFPSEHFRLTPVIGMADGSFAGLQLVDGTVRFIGAPELWNDRPHTPANTALSVEQVGAMMINGYRVLPNLARLRVSRIWGGLIETTPDLLPVLDAPAEYEGLVIGAGFSGHGFGIGPMSGEILANLATRGSDDRFDLEPFRLGRFAGVAG